MRFVNFFRDFVPDYATLAAPIEKLRHVAHISDSLWGAADSQPYNSIVQILTNAPILSLLNFDKEFCVAIDASATCLGAVLYQLLDKLSPDTVSNRQ
jgi:hypothetical protein